MGGSIQTTLEAIESVSSVEDVAQLNRLQEAVNEYFTSPEAAKHLAVWFRLYERFPEDDAYGIFWTILHRLEAQSGFDALVLESVRRKPSGFPVLMINRMLNGGQTKIGDVDLVELLRDVAASENCSPGVREDAKGYLEFQRNRAK